MSNPHSVPSGWIPGSVSGVSWLICVDIGRALHQVSVPVCSEPGAPHVVLLEAFVLGEHRWCVNRISTWALWSWWVGTSHFPRKDSVCRQTNASHLLSWLFDLNIVKYSDREYLGDQQQERDPEFQNQKPHDLIRGLASVTDDVSWGAWHHHRASSLSWPTFKNCIYLKRVFKFLEETITLSREPTHWPFQCQLIPVAYFRHNWPALSCHLWGRAIDYHHLVCWPNFHLPRFHLCPKFSFPIYILFFFLVIILSDPVIHGYIHLLSHLTCCQH